MNLNDIYKEGGLQALKVLAIATRSDVQYLSQCASRWKNKRPSPSLAAKLIKADPRITWDDLYVEEVEAAAKSVAA
jgi:hypothetical protein